MKTHDIKKTSEKNLKISRMSTERSEGGGGLQFGISHKLDPILAPREKKGDYQMNCIYGENKSLRHFPAERKKVL